MCKYLPVFGYMAMVNIGISEKLYTRSNTEKTRKVKSCIIPVNSYDHNGHEELYSAEKFCKSQEDEHPALVLPEVSQEL